MFLNDELKTLIAKETISNSYPYSSGDEVELKNYLKRIAAKLKREKIEVIEEPQNFGSGYASLNEQCAT